MLRKTIFWIHLCCGVTAGLVILMMSATGVLLTYERQILAWVERDSFAPPSASSAESLSVRALLDELREQEPEFAPESVTFRSDALAPVSIGAGRRNSRDLNPYTGELIVASETRLHAFFDAVTGWHRWFNVSGEHRDAARAITGASNLMFLFLVLSGMYLWLPPIYNRVAFRTRLLFNAKARSAKARDFNWHHVMGIWTAIPLAVVVATATVFSYGWANDLVYRSLGEEPPVRGRAAPTASASAAPVPVGGNPLSLDELTLRAAAEVADWKTLTLTLPEADAAVVSFALDRGNGGQPQYRHQLTLDRTTGAVVASLPFSSNTPGRQARSLIRFLHTGEALGIAGQTVAGIVSLTSVIMVWTGLALAWRRLIAPIFRRRKLARAAECTP